MITSSALSLLRLPGAARLLRRALHGRATILMLHRFHCPERGVEGHEPDRLRAFLAYLRKNRFEMLPLQEVVRDLAQGRVRPGAVAFTIDDGYADHVEVAGPIFAEFDCPVTVFVTTGFLDRELWFWWDRIEYVLTHTSRDDVRVVHEGREVAASDLQGGGADRAFAEVVAGAKALTPAQRDSMVEALAREADVEIPARAPDRYAPMSWDQLRRWEGEGMTFAPHTVTHPILSTCDDERSRWELEESWSRLRAEAARPVPVFCYPNGGSTDYGAREVRTLERLGLDGAVTGGPGYAGPLQGPLDRFEIPRFSYTERMDGMVQLVTGFEHLKRVVRREEVA